MDSSVSSIPSIDSPLNQLRQVLRQAINKVVGEDPKLESRISLDRPPRPELGDYSTNAALLLAPRMKMKPREVAERLSSAITSELGLTVEKVQVAGPGFVNIFFSDDWYKNVLEQILAAGERFGSASPENPERILVESVSANPTGPLTAAGARHAAFGDALVRLLRFSGHKVWKEYYFNDSGSQVQRLGESIHARAHARPIPEDGYKGDYVQTLADTIDNADKKSIEELAQEGTKLLIDQIKASLHNFGADFDGWFSEGLLHSGSPNEIEKTIKLLTDNGHIYEKDEALWLRATDFGDDKDRVLIRSSGEYTYFASDIAYFLDKIERGWRKQIIILGADHHGYVARMKAAFAILGNNPDDLELPIMQFVSIVEGGEKASMSKRRGDFVTLNELVGDIGVDAARFFMLHRSHDTTVDLDLALAREQTNENPVYYLQYAHARIASILRKAQDEGVPINSSGYAESDVKLHISERDLIKRLASFPEVVADASAKRAPHRIATYTLELTQTFSGFYRDCQVVGAQPVEVERLRVGLSVAAKRTISCCLEVLGVNAPESM